MPKRGRRPDLTKLQERKAELDAQIKAVKREQREEQLALERERFSVLGRALAKALADDEQLARSLEPIINAHVTKARDRKLLNLPPLAGSSPSAGQ